MQLLRKSKRDAPTDSAGSWLASPALQVPTTTRQTIFNLSALSENVLMFPRVIPVPDMFREEISYKFWPNIHTT